MGPEYRSRSTINYLAVGRWDRRIGPGPINYLAAGRWVRSIGPESGICVIIYRWAKLEFSFILHQHQYIIKSIKIHNTVKAENDDYIFLTVKCIYIRTFNFTTFEKLYNVAISSLDFW